MLSTRITTVLTSLCVALLVSAAAPVATATTLPADGASAAVPAPSAPAGQRGSVRSVELVEEHDSAAVAERVRQFQLDPSRVRFGVDAYRVVYRTIDADDGPTVASALVTLPRQAPSPLPLAAWLHGTRAHRDDVASVAPKSKDRGAALLLAGAGYATVAPDYLGLGESPGQHPYIRTEPTVSASIDALRAGRRVAVHMAQQDAQQHRRVDERVLLSGHSQGGQAATLVAKELQRGVEPHLRLGGLAPISGPYDIEHAELPAALGGRLDPKSATYYLAYLTVSWNRAYHLYDSPTQAFQAPYEHTVPPLFDGQHHEKEIFQTLPADPEQLFTPAFLDSLRHPSGALRRAVRDNDGACTGWRPRVPVRMFASPEDRDVDIENAHRCLGSFVDSGARASLVDVGPVSHFDSMTRALPLVVDWFDTARQ